MKQTSKTNVVVGTNSHSYYPPPIYVRKWILKSIALLCLLSFIFSYTTAVQAQTANFIVVDTTGTSSLDSTQMVKYNKINNGRFCDTSYVVAVGDLKNLQNKGKIEFDLPGLGCCIKATATTVKYTDDNNYAWSANIDEEGTPTCDCEMGSVSLIRKNGEYMAHFSVDDATYSLESVGGGKHILAEIIDFDDGECGTDTGSSPSATIYNEADGMGSGKNNCPVDVLVVYTAAAKDRLADIEMATLLEIEKTNTAFDRSNVKFEIRLAGIEEVDFEETSSITDDLFDNLLIDPAIIALRELYYADLVILLTDGDYGNIIGKAATLTPDKDRSFAIVQACTLPTEKYIFAHELGHLFGCRHQPQTLTPLPIFSQAHEWKIGLFKVRRSIVFGGRGGKKAAQNFSNPNVYHSGKATGILGERNNAAQLNAAHCDIAAFEYDAGVALTGSLEAPFAVCLEEDVLVDAVITGGHVGTYQYTWSYSYDGFTYTSAGYTNLDYAWIPGVYTEPFGSTATFTVYIKLEVTDDDGNTITLFKSVVITDNDAGQDFPCAAGPLRLTNQQQQYLPLASKAVIYPNPVQNILTININSSDNAEIKLIEIFNTKGELIQSKQSSSHIDVQNLASGTYFIRVQTPDERYFEKIIKL